MDNALPEICTRDVAEQLMILLPQICSGIFQLRSKPDTVENGLDLTLNQLTILYTLFRKETLTMSELSNLLQVELSNATQMVDRLYKLDLLTRFSDRSDRRVVRVMLTDNGREITKRYYEAHLQRMLSILESLPEDLQRHLLDCIGVMAVVLDNLQK